MVIHSLRCTLVLVGLLIEVNSLHAAGKDRPAAGLPHVAKWETTSANLIAREETTEFTVPINYKIGRAVSPAIPVAANELVTFAADVQTRFSDKQQDFYRCWLEIEFLRDKKVLDTKTSSELTGTVVIPQLLAITARAPPGATAARLAICAQNKFWAVLDNRATITNVRFLRLVGEQRGALRLDRVGAFSKRSGKRTSTLILQADWPDGTAVNVTTTRGTTAPAFLLSQGRAEIPLVYAEDELGAAEITTRVLDRIESIRVPDPLAATLNIRSIHADSRETPALIQLIHEGDMIPGRYQVSVPGIFMTAPWSIDLAPGKWLLRVCRGPEFQALERTLEVRSGEALTLDHLELKRNVDLRETGWYGGDADGDVYHGEQIYSDVSARTAAEIAQAMGLDWVGVGSWRKPDPKTWGEARKIMRELSQPNFLFLWTDEKPKSREGHVCLVGLERPEDDPFPWGWTGAKRQLRNFELLQLIRASGAATFVNHPLRWWTSGDRFTTNMYAGLPFDLCAAGLLDGYNINEKPEDLAVWSMLLDHGYRVAATAGADFCLDRPIGPPPGKTRMYCHCPNGLNGQALAEAVRQGQTMISTGPVLLADLEGRLPGSTVKAGQTYVVNARAWARGDESDALKRIELWSHGKAIATTPLNDQVHSADVKFSWKPQGDWDWVAVRVVSRRGWAMTSAFYAAGPDWQPPQSSRCNLTFEVSGLSPQDRMQATVEVWNQDPTLVTARKLTSGPFPDDSVMEVPVDATIVIQAADGRRKQVSVYDAIGIQEQIESIASGKERQRPLLNWQTYEDVLNRCRKARAVVTFEK